MRLTILTVVVVPSPKAWPPSGSRCVVDASVEDAGCGASVAAPVVREVRYALYNLPLQPVGCSATGSGGQN